MSSIFGLIAQYKGDLSIFPTVIIIFVLATLLCFILFSKMKWLKYIPGLIGMTMGAVFAWDGIQAAVEPGGLETIWKGIYFFVAGCIALGTAWIIALLASMTSPNRTTTVTKRTKVKKIPKSEDSYMDPEDVNVVMGRMPNPVDARIATEDVELGQDVRFDEYGNPINDGAYPYMDDQNPESFEGSQNLEPFEASQSQERPYTIDTMHGFHGIDEADTNYDYVSSNQINDSLDQEQVGDVVYNEGSGPLKADFEETRRLDPITENDINLVSHADQQAYQPKDASKLD